MTAMRIGNSKDALIQGMKLLNNILEVMEKPDAKRMLSEVISMTEDEARVAAEAKSYVEDSVRLKAEITADREVADKMMADATVFMQEAKAAQAASKTALVAAESRLSAITEKQRNTGSQHAEKDAQHLGERKALDEQKAVQDERDVKQTAKQTQLDELETKLRGKAAQAAQIMQGV